MMTNTVVPNVNFSTIDLLSALMPSLTTSAVKQADKADVTGELDASFLDVLQECLDCEAPDAQNSEEQVQIDLALLGAARPSSAQLNKVNIKQDDISNNKVDLKSDLEKLLLEKNNINKNSKNINPKVVQILDPLIQSQSKESIKVLDEMNEVSENIENNENGNNEKVEFKGLKEKSENTLSSLLTPVTNPTVSKFEIHSNEKVKTSNASTPVNQNINSSIPNLADKKVIEASAQENQPKVLSNPEKQNFIQKYAQQVPNNSFAPIISKNNFEKVEINPTINQIAQFTQPIQAKKVGPSGNFATKSQDLPKDLLIDKMDNSNISLVSALPNISDFGIKENTTENTKPVTTEVVQLKQNDDAIKVASNYIIQNKEKLQQNKPVEITIDQTPLGKMKFLVEKSDNNQIKVSIMTHTPMASEFLSQNKNNIIEALNNQGMSVREFQVEMGQSQFLKQEHFSTSANLADSNPNSRTIQISNQQVMAQSGIDQTSILSTNRSQMQQDFNLNNKLSHGSNFTSAQLDSPKFSNNISEITKSSDLSNSQFNNVANSHDQARKDSQRRAFLWEYAKNRGF